MKYVITLAVLFATIQTVRAQETFLTEGDRVSHEVVEHVKEAMKRDPGEDEPLTPHQKVLQEQYAKDHADELKERKELFDHWPSYTMPKTDWNLYKLPDSTK